MRHAATLLTGREVIVTRPRAQADGLAFPLRAAGAIVTICPAIAIVDAANPALTAAFDRLSAYDRIICTSANAARAIVRQLDALPVRPATLPRIAAIGADTATALAEANLRYDPLPDSASSDALFRSLGTIRGERLLLPRSDLADARLPDACRQAGAIVDAVVAYRTVTDPALRELPEILQSRHPDAVTLASASAARAVAAALTGVAVMTTGALASARPAFACIGPATAAAARLAGLPVDIVAQSHDSDGLVAALAAWFADTSTTAR